ncbi:ATP phosphoribosyltransferase regulatory subunit [Roseobacteraceae bacterium S113]
MTTPADIRAEAERLTAGFEGLQARRVLTPVLQSAEVLLELYGEDIRGRAYVTSDPLRGEQMLRPDFTVPVVQMHMAEGAEPARYCYAGEVFRRQDDDPSRENEYIQVGYEVFDRADPAAREAEVFAAIAAPLTGLPVRAVTGDIGLLKAAVAGLNTSERRKSALMRHIWRPRRFRALLERFAGQSQVPPSREALLRAADPFADAGPATGKRSQAEVAARIEALREDAALPPISGDDVAQIDALLSVRETLPHALTRLAELAERLPAIAPAVGRLEERIEALAQAGQNPATLAFEGSFGRSSMEYYDGFVFGFTSDARPDWPAIASGGRYDALTAALGQGRSIPAVGGVLRPGLLLALKEMRA